MTFPDVWPVLSAIGGGAVALWGFLSLSPAKFLERGFGHYLDKRLADSKQEHNRQIESLKSDLAHLADRSIRSNEREYEALAAAWSKFMDAFYATRRTVGDFRTIPDFARMGDDKVRAYLAFEKVGEEWTEQILGSANRQTSYLNMQRIKTINEAGKAIAATRDAVRRQSVFMPASIEALFEAAIETLQTAQSESRTQAEIGPVPEFKSALRLIGPEGDVMFNGIRDAVRDRLLRHSSFQRNRTINGSRDAPTYYLSYP